jgi:hypothetical protein
LGARRNTALGTEALLSNTLGSDNIAIGYGAANDNTIGGGNIAIGNFALGSTTGSNNVAIGYSSLQGNTSGNSNVSIGDAIVIPGSYCTALGSSISLAGSTQFATAIGAQSTVTCSNCMTLGGDDPTSRTKVGVNIAAPVTDLHIIQQTDATFDNSRGIRLQRPSGNQWRVFLDPGNNYVFQYNNNLFSYIEPVSASYVSSSDERLKTDINPLPGILDKLMQLQPKTYQYTASADANRRSYGFLAQDVEKLFPEFVFSSENGIKGIAYSNFSVIAVKAIQEQQKVIDEQKQKIDQLEHQMELMMKRMDSYEKKN